MADETITRLCPTCLHDGTLELALARADAAEAGLARVRHLAKCWAGLPPGGGAGLPLPDATAAVLREAGAELLRRIAGGGESEVPHG